MNSNENWKSLAANRQIQHALSNHSRRKQDHVNIPQRDDMPIRDIVAAREHERFFLLQLRFDLVAINSGRNLVGQQHHYDIREIGCGLDWKRFKAVTAGHIPTRVLLIADNHVMARATQINRLRTPLIAVPDHSDRLSFQELGVGLFLLKEFRHNKPPSSISRI